MGRPRSFTAEERRVRDKESCSRYRQRTREQQRIRSRVYSNNNRDAINARNRARHKAVMVGAKANKFPGSKPCRLCNETKLLSDFFLHPCASDRHRSECKACMKTIRAAKYLQNRTEILARCRATYQKNIEARRSYDRKRRKADPELFKERARIKFQKHKEDITLAKRHRRHTDMSYRIESNMRNRLNTLLRRYKQRGCVAKKADYTAALLGCSFADFVIYLESKFEVGMSWENYGGGWHVDHIMPCAIFDLSRAEHQKRCFHFSNMQPLWAEQNISKHAKVLDGQFRLI